MITGLREDANLNTIVTAMRRVENQWIDLRTPERRVTEIANAILGILRTLDVPEPTLLVVSPGAGLNGLFDPGPWTVTINPDLGKGTPAAIGSADGRKKTVALLGDIITHECRHCEQFFRIVRYVIDKDRWDRGAAPRAAQLNGRLGVDVPVCDAALLRPPLTPEEVEETAPWFESIYGRGAQFRQVNVVGWERGHQLRQTGSAIGQLVQNSLWARYQQAVAEEDDAHQTGQELQRKFLAGSGIPPQVPIFGHRPVAQGVARY